MNTQLGQIACEAWTASHQAHHGPDCKIVPWNELKEQEREDWQRAALAVLATMPPYGWMEAR